MRSSALIFIGLIACIGMVARAQSQMPSGWKTLHSVTQVPATLAGKPVRDGKCTLAVPADWIEDNTIDRSQARSRDGSAQAFIQQWPAGPHDTTFVERTRSTLSVYHKQVADNQRVDPHFHTDIKVLENSPKRLSVQRIAAKSILNSGVTDWTILAAGNPICYAMVTVLYTDPNDDSNYRAVAQRLLPVAQRIVASFTPAD